MKNLCLLVLCFFSINVYANTVVANKGIGYQSPIKVNDKDTYDYISKILLGKQADYYFEVLDFIKIKGNASYDTLKSACYLEGSSNSVLDFIKINKNYMNLRTYNSLIDYSNSTLSTAQKITLGRCAEVSAIIKKQDDVDSKIREQEFLNNVINTK